MAVSLSEDAKTRYATDNVPAEALEAYGSILLAIAGADGEISPPEMAWFKSWADSVGATDAVRAKWSGFVASGIDLEGLIDSMRKKRKSEWAQRIKAKGSINYARALVYDAIRMARADNDYHPDEEEAVKRASAMLHVDPATRRSIEALVDLEEGVNALRRSLFMR